MKHQVYFSKDFEMGVGSWVDVNCKNIMTLKGSDWGSNSQIEKVYPRGKSYWRMFDMQFEKFSGIRGMNDV